MMLKLLDIVRKQAKEAQAQKFLAQGRLLLVYKELLTPITGLLDWKQEELEEVLDQLQRPDEKECASAEPCSFL